jgi:hypothetical protein
MAALITFLVPFAIAMVITYNWLKGIEHMRDKHPDYKGEDLFGEEEDKK